MSYLCLDEGLPHGLPPLGLVPLDLPQLPGQLLDLARRPPPDMPEQAREGVHPLHPQTDGAHLLGAHVVGEDGGPRGQEVPPVVLHLGTASK